MSRPDAGPGGDLRRLIAVFRRHRTEAMRMEPASLMALTEEISVLCDRIERGVVATDPCERALLAQAGALAEQGQRDVRALARGVGAVIAQLRAAQAPQRHGVYGPAGERVDMAPSVPLLERRH